jgi:hypothetical protein
MERSVEALKRIRKHVKEDNCDLLVIDSAELLFIYNFYGEKRKIYIHAILELLDEGLLQDIVFLVGGSTYVHKFKELVKELSIAFDVEKIHKVVTGKVDEDVVKFVLEVFLNKGKSEINYYDLMEVLKINGGGRKERLLRKIIEALIDEQYLVPLDRRWLYKINK